MPRTQIADRQLKTSPGLASLAPAWTSGSQSWTFAQSLTLNHTLGRMPHLVRADWICITAETIDSVSYAIGDRVPGDFWSQGSNTFGILIRKISNSHIVLYPFNPTNGNGFLTSSRWSVIVDLW